jgi:hypothetical protein
MHATGVQQQQADSAAQAQQHATPIRTPRQHRQFPPDGRLSVKGQQLLDYVPQAILQNEVRPTKSACPPHPLLFQNKGTN